MASGWAQDGAVQEQIDATLDSAVERARQHLPKGESLSHCELCGEPIAEPRRVALPGVRLCLACQAEQEKNGRVDAGYNRSASKDSQLR
ncbi:DksA/TraR family C4-type zinc finger protein [Halopseudomonas maritima]|uniref:DksA/TraR family C4-type zinc finger protein n=1 Tax=Halopseudomonas maritima TaxID=2918528 RepID=UPI001EEC6CC8|nr:DksA/TraR family C4-type zinc finger protein [Halopseudomonas maritima]UJJ32787.1 DksA/TraR family C4-type zinc finger protein [Halopseudomonas maritima]